MWRYQRPLEKVIPLDPSLSTDERKLLLDLAYEAVKATAEKSPTPQIALDQLPEGLCRPAATFVTITCKGTLRGCIGTTKPQQALALDVVHRASLAASSDPRFPAITPDEIAYLEIEISVLSTPQPMMFSNPEQLLMSLDPGIDGVIITKGLHRATFLPQVWERVSEPQAFIELLCQKASLHRDAWRTEKISVETYRVESFHREPDSLNKK